MRSLKIILFIIVSICLYVVTANPTQKVQQSHINANLPSAFEGFSKTLERDLTKYFSSSSNQKVTVQYELLRKTPTQSGVAYPKFYAWVKILNSGKKIEEGAVRITAIDKTHVEVTHFISKKQIIKSPKYIETVFPSSLCNNIRLKAGIK